MKQPILVQRIEAACLLGVSIYFYNYFDFSFVWFLVLLFVVDISMVGYLVNNRVGACLYNIGHSLTIPAVLVVLGASYGNATLLAAALIWIAHIGLDRVLGYGLKLETSFKNTHLGRIGKDK